MTIAKKIIKGLVESGIETVKDSTKQVAGTVNPVKLIESAVGAGTPTVGSEMGNYLKNVSPDMTSAQLEAKKKELSEDDQKKMEEARKALRPGLPDYLKPAQKPKELSPYEASLQEKERKTAMAVEMQKKEQGSVHEVSTKQTRGLLGRLRKPKASGFETGKNIKVG